MSAYHPFFAGRKPTLHISHRGGAALAPENTLFAFRSAVDRWRTDMLELDVHFSRDGVAWVSHDATVDRCTDGTGAISDLSSAELAKLDAGYRFSPDGRTFPCRSQGVRLPRLSEVLEAFPALPINVDLKADAPGTPEALAGVIRTHRAESRICCGAEELAPAERLADLLPGVCQFFPRDVLTAFVMGVRAGEPPPDDARFHVLDMPLHYQGVRLVDDALLSTARARGKWINVWTVDDEAEMRQLAREGVGGVMTDRPDLLRAALDG